jgi:hypothetical protein
MATSRKELEELHVLVARSYKNRIEQDINDNIPTDAATLSGAVKFLKDNAITADPADQDDLSELRDRLKEQAEKRRKRNGTHLQLAQSDMDAMEG